VFIEYESPEEAARAQREFAGRRFDGRMLLTSFYPEAMFPPSGPILPKPAAAPPFKPEPSHTNEGE